jgi:signal transduction histidine kinase
LLVEDDPGYARLLREILAETQDFSHTFSEATSLERALTSLDGGGYDIALLDLGLPDADGTEALERVVARAPELPIVVLSTSNDLSVALESMRAGAQDYLVKGQSEVVLLPRAIRYAIERKRLQAEATHARAEAERANAAKDRFLAMLGHELRNPLAPIVSALALLERRADPNIERERVIMARQVKHLVRLVDDLLDVSRIVRGKLELRRETVNLSEAVSDSVEAASPLLERSQHKLVLSSPDSPLFVSGDRTRLAQVFTNLLTNAAKYTDPGGTISVSLLKDGDHAEVVVRDDGVGISEELAPRLFELFEQGYRTLDRAAGGLGLGLAIVKSIVALHHGTVRASSPGPGRGSEFRVQFPLELQRGSARHPSRSRPPTAARVAKRILVVDDNADGAELIARTLDGMGHVTRVAHDGLEALDSARKFSPDVILLDIGLPIVDGYEVARQLRETELRQKPALIAVTGYGQESDYERSFAEGFSHHLVKPIDLAQLESALASLSEEE